MQEPHQRLPRASLSNQKKPTPEPCLASTASPLGPEVQATVKDPEP